MHILLLFFPIILCLPAQTLLHSASIFSLFCHIFCLNKLKNFEVWDSLPHSVLDLLGVGLGEETDMMSVSSPSPTPSRVTCYCPNIMYSQGFKTKLICPRKHYDERGCQSRCAYYGEIINYYRAWLACHRRKTKMKPGSITNIYIQENLPLYGNTLYYPALLDEVRAARRICRRRMCVRLLTKTGKWW